MLTLVDFTYDVLDGCIHDCQGCNVIKSDGRDITQEQYETLLSFFKKLKKEKPESSFDIINIGPTDFSISTNTEKIMKMSTELMDMFSSIQLACTMTYKEEALKERLLLLKPYLDGRKLRITIPLHSRNVRNKKFHDLVDSNIETLQETLPNAVIDKLVYQINVTEYPSDKENPILNATEDILIGKVKDIDITIPDGRGNMKDLNQVMKLKNTIDRMKRLHLEYYDGDDTGKKYPLSLEQLYSEALNVNQKILINGEWVPFEDYDLIYQKGRLYRPAHYGEEIVIHHDDFSVPWVSDDIGILDELEAKVMSSQIELMDDHCSQCHLSEECMFNCGILVKHLIKEKECIYPMSNIIKFYKTR